MESQYSSSNSKEDSNRKIKAEWKILEDEILKYWDRYTCPSTPQDIKDILMDIIVIKKKRQASLSISFLEMAHQSGNYVIYRFQLN